MQPEYIAPPKKKISPWVWVLVVCVGMCLPCLAVFGAILFPVFAQARIAAKQAQTVVSLKTVGDAMMAYVADHDDKFPPKMTTLSETWPEMSAYTRENLPTSLNPDNPNFAGNEHIAGQSIAKIPNLPKTFASEPKLNRGTS